MTVGELKKLLLLFPNDMVVICPCDSEDDYAHYSFPHLEAEEFNTTVNGFIGDTRKTQDKPFKTRFLVIQADEVNA